MDKLADTIFRSLLKKGCEVGTSDLLHALMHPSAWRNRPKSLGGAHSVAPQTTQKVIFAPFRPSQRPDPPSQGCSETLFRTVSEKLFGNSGEVPNGSSESGQEGSKESRFGRLLLPERRPETPSSIFQTVSRDSLKGPDRRRIVVPPSPEYTFKGLASAFRAVKAPLSKVLKALLCRWDLRATRACRPLPHMGSHAPTGGDWLGPSSAC